MSDTLTDAQIDEGLRLAGEATPGLEWVGREADKAFIAHAATHYAAALREVQALREQVQALTNERDRARELARDFANQAHWAKNLDIRKCGDEHPKCKEITTWPK